MEKKIGIIETAVLYILLLFPVFGMFTPSEDYIRPRIWSLAFASQNSLDASYPFSHFLYLFFFICLAVYTGIFWRGFAFQLRHMWLIVFLVMWGFASATWSVSADNTVKRVVRMSEYVGFAIYLVHRFNLRDLVTILNRAFFIVVVCSYGAVIFFPNLAFANLTGYETAWRGAMVHKNELGAITAMGLIFSGYAIAIKTNKPYTRYVNFFGGLLLLILSRSATSMIATLACVTVLVLYTGIKVGGNPVLRTAAVSVMLAGIIMLIGLLLNAESATDMLGRSGNLTGRTGVWDAVIQTINLRPVTGYGYGFWGPDSVPKMNIWTTVGFSVPHAHNDWLDISLQLGLVGAGLLALCWLRMFGRCVVFNMLNAPGTFFCTLILTNLFVRSLTETTIVDPSVTNWTWFTMVYLCLARISREQKEELRQRQDMRMMYNTA